ncbi:hypothetical protein PRIPAC_71876 [Pristionchus pacificus]|uniref:Uncharacterized protein n=1 Tax=Pristionchus pacificus TaxID=54126 RepID=A0A454XZA6_PRIPA|nr:hypothetical protein PRIPAC_71876 [Pristionchus pacificus]|eukprot:PDM71445.1 hypothetical protein PRIPAC_37852 [Pristionchus pacificus]
MRLTLLLLLSIGLVAAAPAARDYEKEAREFFGRAANLGKEGKYGEVFDMFSAKREEFIPGLLKHDQIQKIRKTIVDEFEKKQAPGDFTGKDMSDLIDIAWQGVKYTLKKDELLTKEASKFFDKTPIFPKEISDLKKLIEVSPNFVEYRKKFEALDAPSKASLIKAYPAYGRLDEIQASPVPNYSGCAYGKVFDSIIRNLKGLCTELPGFDECDKLLKAL